MQRKNEIYVPLWRAKQSLSFIEKVLKEKSWTRPAIKKQIQNLFVFYQLDQDHVEKSLRELLAIYKQKIKELESLK